MNMFIAIYFSFPNELIIDYSVAHNPNVNTSHILHLLQYFKYRFCYLIIHLTLLSLL